MVSQALKLAVALFLLTVSVLLAGCTARTAPSPQSAATTNIVTPRSGKVLIRFKQFEFGKDWAADFEITNDTNGPISYVGNKTNSDAYCTLAAKLENQNIAFTIRDFCTLGNLVSLQTLDSGQSMVLAAQKNEIQNLLYKNDLSSTVTAQIGFEVFVGNDRHREMVWSEQITFPNQDHP